MSSEHHQFGDLRVQVATRDRNLFLYRRQGLRVTPRRRRRRFLFITTWAKVRVDRIDTGITLSGAVVAPAQADGSCNSCDQLTVMGKTWWGVNVSRPYDRVVYRGTVQDGEETFPISGTLLY